MLPANSSRHHVDAQLDSVTPKRGMVVTVDRWRAAAAGSAACRPAGHVIPKNVTACTYPRSVGRASRKKRERRMARSRLEPSAVGHLDPVLDAGEPDGKGGTEELRRRWGGPRIGAGRPRLYVTAAERQAAYRARKRAVTDADGERQPEGKPSEGGAPAIDRLVARDPCA